MDWNALGDWIWQTLLDLALLAPLGTLMAVVIAYIAYVQRSTADRLTIQQKTEADNRNAWWSRVQWAIDAGLSDDRQRRTAGMVAIEQMQGSSLATSGDQKLLEAIAFEVLEKLEISAEISVAPDEQPDFMANDQRIGHKSGATREVVPAMTDQHTCNEKDVRSDHPRKYPVTLESQNGRIFYAKDAIDKRTMEIADRIIMTARKKTGEAYPPA